MTTAAHGGYQAHGNTAGITFRYVFNHPVDAADSVASSNMKKSLIIRIFMMSTKI